MRTVALPILSTILFAVTASGFLYAQEPLTPAINQPGPVLRDTISAALSSRHGFGRPEWHSMFTNIPGDWVRGYRQVFQPFQLQSFLGMTALTAALVATDEESWKFADHLYHSSDFTRETNEVFVALGDGAPQFGMAAAFALVGWVTDDDRAVRTASQTVEALLSCSVVVHVIKHATGRERPSHASAPGGVWDVFPNQSRFFRHTPRYDAFPSGHISSTTAILTVIMENYPEATWLRPASYVIIGLVGLGITNKGMHWYSDLPLGIALGHMFGMIAAHPDGADMNAPVPTGEVQFSVMPAYSDEGVGLSVAIQF
jgi:membrane-associated PAP2 superfamily phosphatase